jgi:hypothetical protein
MLGIGAYADGSRLIDDNIRSFKGLRQETENLNKKLQSDAGQKADLDTLRDIGQEMAFTQGKKMFAKYGSKIYSGKIPFSDGLSIEDLDKQAGKGLDSVLDRAFDAGKNIPAPLGQDSNIAVNDVNTLNTSINAPEIDSSVSFQTSSVDKPAIGGTDEVNIVKSSSSEIEMTEGAKSSGFAGVETTEPEGVNLVGEGTTTLKSDVGEVAEEGADVAEGLGADVATEEGLQAGAGVLASTGILAPLAGAVEVGADIFALYEAGKSIGDWFSRDILHQTAPADVPQATLPSAPKTLAQKGFLVTPSVDTYDLPHSTVGSNW